MRVCRQLPLTQTGDKSLAIYKGTASKRTASSWAQVRLTDALLKASSPTTLAEQTFRYSSGKVSLSTPPRRTLQRRLLDRAPLLCKAITIRTKRKAVPQAT